MKTLHITFLLSAISIFSFSGCMEKVSNDAEESYMLWAGEKANKDIKVIHGKYWQSAHFTREYIVYLELVATPIWRKEFIKQNHLINTPDPVVPDNAPQWFNPSKKSKLWKQQNAIGSTYFEDSDTGHFFIYEEQL